MSDLQVLRDKRKPLIACMNNGNIEYRQSNLKDETSYCKWHQRLGHQSINQVKKFAALQGIKLTGEMGDHMCETCALSKITRTMSRGTRARAEEFLDKVHADVIGPFKPLGYTGGEQYALTLVDDYSRALYVYPQKGNTAGETLNSLKQFCSEVGSLPKEMQMDGGSEFKAEFNDYCVEHRIQTTMSPPYAHYLNGVVERKIRTLKEMTRCLLESSQLPHVFWPEAMLTAQYLLYRAQLRVIDWKSPYQLIHKSVPKGSHLKTFGAKVIFHRGEPRGSGDAYNTKSSTAFENKGREGILLGYGRNYNTGTYVILDTETYERVHSNNIIAFEDKNIQHTKAYAFFKDEDREYVEFEAHDTTYDPEDEISDSEDDLDSDSESNVDATPSREYEW